MTPPDAARWKLAVHPRLNTIIGEYAARHDPAAACHDPAADHGRDEWAGPARPWAEEWGTRAGDAMDRPDQNVWGTCDEEWGAHADHDVRASGAWAEAE